MESTLDHYSFFSQILNFNFISRKKLELSFLFLGGEIGLISGIQIAPLHTPNWASSFPWYPHVEMGGIFISSRLPEGLNTPSHDALLVWFDQRTVVWFPSCWFHSRDRSRTSSRPSPHCTSIQKSSRVSSLSSPLFSLSPLTYFEEEASFCILWSCIFLSCLLEMNS